MYFHDYNSDNSSTVNYMGISTLLHVFAGLMTLVISVTMPPKIIPPEVIEVEMLPPKGVQMRSASAPAPAAPEIKRAPLEKLPSQDIGLAKPRKMIAAQKVKVAKAAPAARSSRGSSEKFIPNFEVSQKEVLNIPDDEPLPEVPVFNEGEESFVSDTVSAGVLKEGIGNAKSQDTDTSGERLIGEIGSDTDRLAESGVSAIDGALDSMKKNSGSMKEGIRQRGASERALISGMGAGGAGSAKKAFGSPNGVIRRLEDLRQMPGNPKPNYTIEDRVKRRSGEVKFLVYINNRGVPESVRMTQSSGFETLDLRAQKAVKKFRFYAGQEGFVEIPFNYQLRGGTQTASAE